MMRLASDPASRARRRAALALLATFMAGALAGAGVEHLRAARAPQGFPAGLPLPPPFEELDLTATQRDRILEILERRRPEMDAIMAEVLPRMRAVATSVDAEVRGALTPEQREKLDQIRAQRIILPAPRLCPPGASSCPPPILLGPPGSGPPLPPPGFVVPIH